MQERAQTTLELTAALILLMLLLAGATKIFMWLSGRMVHRQVLYEASRVHAADCSTWNGTITNLSDPNQIKGVEEPDESTYPALNVFK